MRPKNSSPIELDTFLLFNNESTFHTAACGPKSMILASKQKSFAQFVLFDKLELSPLIMGLMHL
jgi:hypothetical protein